MLSSPTDFSTRPSAEAAYRDAFERLKRGEPERLSAGTPVSQNNVAKEAGCDPSALKKSRFPTLIMEIQRYVLEKADDQPPSHRQTLRVQRRKNRSLRDRIDTIIKQRDAVTVCLNEANATILELTDRVRELEVQMPPSKRVWSST